MQITSIFTKQMIVGQELRKNQEKTHQIVAFRLFIGIFKIWFSYQHAGDNNNNQVLLLIWVTLFVEVCNFFYNLILMYLILQLGSLEELVTKRPITAFHYASDFIYHLIVDLSTGQSLTLLINLEMYNNVIKFFGISIRYINTSLQILVLYFYQFQQPLILQIYLYFLIFPLAVLLYQFVIYLFCKIDKNQSNKNLQQTYIRELKFNNEICSICLLGFTNLLDIIQLPCHKSHIFHSYCCHKWIMANKTCPLCRTGIVFKKLQQY